MSNLSDYYTYQEIAAAVFIVLVIVFGVVYYANQISKFNKRMKAINSLNDRLTLLLNKEANLNEELFYCLVEKRQEEIRQELRAIDDEWNQVVDDLKKISLED